MKSVFQPMHPLHDLFCMLPPGNSEVAVDTPFYVRMSDVTSAHNDVQEFFLPLAGIIAPQGAEIEDYCFVLIELTDNLTKQFFTKLDLMLYQKTGVTH